MLSHYRILDLTDGSCMIAGSLLADMGADVIQIEPPGGAPSRSWRSWGGSACDREPSSTWLSYARNKRGIVLDLQQPAGRARFLELAATADAVIESFPPGFLASLGLGYDDLRRVNPAIVYTSITPYGQAGPKRDWPATDLTVWASAGFMFPNGDADRAPLAITIPQAFVHAGLDALLGTLIALRERRHSGEGQHIDIAAQHSAMFAALPNQLAVAWNDPAGIYRRVALGSNVGGRFMRWVYPARNGLVSVLLLFGTTFGPYTARLFDWIYEEGLCDHETSKTDWIEYGARLVAGDVSDEELARIQSIVADFVASKTKQELWEAAFTRGLLTSPVYTVEDARRDPHLLAREYWTAADGGPAAGPAYPGPFARFSQTPLRYVRPAPRLGEHDAEVTAERANPGAGRTVGAPRTETPPLHGIKVVDFGRVYVMPASMRPLSDFGATVVRINSTLYADTAQTLAPMKDGIFAPERGAIFHDGNAGKLGLALNMATPGGLEVARRLVAWADVVAEGFPSRVMKKFGLDYESVRAFNPGVVYVSGSLCGLTGPYGGLAGYGTTGASLMGVNTLCGWPDRPPAGTAGAYTDIGTPRFITAAVLAALEHRERTGVGQHIDVSHVEACTHYLTPAYVEYERTGHIVSAAGNRSPDYTPHGCFPTAGTDRWIVLAVENTDQWRALCGLAGMPGLACEPSLATLEGRKGREDEIETCIARWTSRLPAEELLHLLIGAGIPASIVADPNDLVADEQLRFRKAWTELPDPQLGSVVVQSPRIALSRTPGAIGRSAPIGARDAHLVLSEFLGYIDAEIADLAAAGALQ